MKSRLDTCKYCGGTLMIEPSANAKLKYVYRCAYCKRID